MVGSEVHQVIREIFGWASAGAIAAYIAKLLVEWLAEAALA